MQQVKDSSVSNKQQRFMAMYLPYHMNLQRFVQSLVWEREEARDVISETLLIAFEKLDSVKAPDKFLYFLFGIASHVVGKMNRRKKFKGTYHDSDALALESTNTAEYSVQQRELKRLLALLPEKQREALVLFEINGFSIKEIGAIQNLSESGVKSNLKRGRDYLMRYVKESVNPSIQPHHAE